MSTTMKYGHLSEKEKLRWELESLRQENSRLREVMLEGMTLCKEKDVEIHQLREDWEVMGEDLENASRENNRLREALKEIAAYRLGGVKITTSHIAERALNPPKRS